MITDGAVINRATLKPWHLLTLCLCTGFVLGLYQPVDRLAQVFWHWLNNHIFIKCTMSQSLLRVYKVASRNDLDMLL